jgi:hypothetical protein
MQCGEGFMTIQSRRRSPAAFLFCLAVCGCADIGVDADAGPGGSDADAGPGVDGGEPGPDGGGGPLPPPGWPPPPPPPPAAMAYAPVYAVTAANQLVLVSADAPSTVLRTTPIVGLAAGEQVNGIDFRPATGELYALGSTSRLYVIDPATGAATAIGAAPLATPLAGSFFGLDFNPTVDRIRVVSDTGANLRLHPTTGDIAGTDTNLAYDALDAGAGAAPRVVGSAYTASFLGSSRTTLFGIDVDRDALVRQGSDGGAPASPNSGALFTVGALGLDVADVAGFDIADRDAAFAALVPAGGAPQLAIINLATGAATPLGPLGDGSAIRGLAVPTPPPPMVYAVTDTNKLVGFSAGAPGAVVGWVPLTGLAADEAMLAIDFRPATGELYGISSADRIHVIDIATGAVTPIGAPFTPSLATSPVGLDFNPTVDRIRVVTASRQNLRLHPDTGAVAGIDVGVWYSPLDAGAGIPPRLAGSAYTGNFLGSTRTTLFGIDTGRDMLVRQGSDGGAPTSPNTGTLFSVGALGIDASDLLGFDIAARDAAFAAIAPEGAAAGLYVINLATGAAASLGAIGGGETVRGIAVPPPSPPTVYAVTRTNTLLSFRADAPDTLLDSVAVSGLAGGETLLGIDFRPATGQLYALGSTGQLYRLDVETGAATAVGVAQAPVAGVEIGFDFNPTVDRIRVVGGGGQNLRLHPVTGEVAGVDTDLAYDAGDAGAGQAPRAVGAAYTASFFGSTRTTLYDIDAERDVLVRQGSDGGAPISPNTGSLFTVGALGVDVSDLAGVDIAATGAAFAVLVPADSSAPQLHAINLATGALIPLGQVASADAIAAAAVAP